LEWDDGRSLNIGETIVAEGPGGGAAMVPWCLDHYERMLRLRPVESWLLRRMLAHAWSWRTPVYLSLSKIEAESKVTRKTLSTTMSRLQELGYVYCVSDGVGDDRRRRYDVTGLCVALAICVACDPWSKWAQENGGPLSVEEARRSGHVVYLPDGTQKTVSFDLDFDALHWLAERQRPPEADEGENAEL